MPSLRNAAPVLKYRLTGVRAEQELVWYVVIVCNLSAGIYG